MQKVSLWRQCYGLNSISSLPSYLASHISKDRYFSDKYEFHDESDDNIYVYRGRRLIETIHMSERRRQIELQQIRDREKKENELRQVQSDLIQLTRVLREKRIPLHLHKLFRRFIKKEIRISNPIYEGIDELFVQE